MSSRTLARHLGRALLLGGVLMLAWVFVVWQWGDPFTAAYTRWQQHKLAGQYEQLARAYTPPAPVKKPQRAVSRVSQKELMRQRHVAATAFRKSAEEGGPIGRLRVPRLDLDMVMLNGTDSDTLKKGPGRDPRTYMPGQGELVYVAGHRTTFGAPFAHIERMKKGDRIFVEMPYGTFEYVVTRWVIVPATDLDRLESHGHEVLALQACHPRFSSRKRYIVYATPKPPRA